MHSDTLEITLERREITICCKSLQIIKEAKMVMILKNLEAKFKEEQIKLI